MQPRRDGLVEIFVDRVRLEQRNLVVDAQHRHLLVRRDGEEPVGPVVAVDMLEFELDALLAQHDRRALHPRAGLEADKQIFRHDALVLSFAFSVVRFDERLNLVRHAQELQPLLLVQGHWKTAHAVDREAPFSLTFMRMPAEAPFLRAAFSLRRRSSSAFRSSSDILPVCWWPNDRDGKLRPPSRSWSRNSARFPRCSGRGGKSASASNWAPGSRGAGCPCRRGACFIASKPRLPNATWSITPESGRCSLSVPEMSLICSTGWPSL